MAVLELKFDATKLKNMLDRAKGDITQKAGQAFLKCNEKLAERMKTSYAGVIPFYTGALRESIHTDKASSSGTIIKQSIVVGSAKAWYALAYHEVQEGQVNNPYGFYIEKRKTGIYKYIEKGVIPLLPNEYPQIFKESME